MSDPTDLTHEEAADIVEGVITTAEPALSESEMRDLGRVFHHLEQWSEIIDFQPPGQMRASSEFETARELDISGGVRRAGSGELSRDTEADDGSEEP